MGEGVAEEEESSDPPREGADDGTLPEDLEEVREALLAWYEADHREFPWRETDDPYAILVSEVMSQQTQLDRVLESWSDFLDRWPTVEDLAGADRSAVVGFWSEHRLGYNNRAKYLHEAAGQVIEDFGGVFPRDPDGLQELQGVGPYTANAVASFAFDNGEAVVDTNVKRVLYRAFSVPDERKAFEASASELMPAEESRRWNNAIMELGGTTCEKTPRCDEKECPWREWCGAYASGDFSAPDVPSQAPFEGSRRQFRGRIVEVLRTQEALALDDLGPRIRVDYSPEGTYGRAWLYDLAAGLAADGIVEVVNRDEGEDAAEGGDDAENDEKDREWSPDGERTVVRLRR
jgi:A/G-specific adenine glycosylase